MYSHYLHKTLGQSYYPTAEDFDYHVRQSIELFHNCTRRKGLRACLYDSDLYKKMRVSSPLLYGFDIICFYFRVVIWFISFWFVCCCCCFFFYLFFFSFFFLLFVCLFVCLFFFLLFVVFFFHLSVFVLSLVYPMVSVSLGSAFWIAPSVFSNVNFRHGQSLRTWELLGVFI